MATNRVTGMYSGIDTEGLISQLMEAKKVKVDKTKKDQMTIKYKQEAWDDLNKKVKSLFGTISNLRYESSFSKSKTEISDSSIATITTAENAMNTTQKMQVTKLAQNAYLTGDEIKAGSGKVTAGTLLKNIDPSLVDKSISITLDNGTTKEIKITDKTTLSSLTADLTNAGVNCKFDAATQRIFIGATKNGKAGDFTLGGDAVALSTLGLDSANKIPGEDGSIILNGAEFHSSDNTYEINGLTITAKAETDGKEVTLTTSKDTSAVYDMIKKFVKEYSDLMNEMDKLYNADTKTKYQPLTDEEKAAMSDYEIEQWETKMKEQLLAKDSNINSVSSVLKEVMSQGFEVGGKTLYLFNFGIETGGYFETADNEKNAYHIKGDEEDSLYSTSTNELQKMIESDPDSVAKFFSQLGKELYERMDKMSARVNDTRSYGSFFDDIKLKKDYTDYTSKIADMEEKLAQYEDKWYDKFAKMESAMAKMQSNQNAISGLFGGGN